MDGFELSDDCLRHLECVGISAEVAWEDARAGHVLNGLPNLQGFCGQPELVESIVVLVPVMIGVVGLGQ